MTQSNQDYLIINEWDKSIGESQIVGFGDMRNVDIYSVPGVVRVNKETGAVATSPTDLVKWFSRDNTNGQYYALGDTGKVYKYTTVDAWKVVAGNTTTSATGNGLCIWKDYLLVARNNLIDAYGPLSGTPAWTSGFCTLNSTNDKWHQMIVGIDDIVYIADGRYVASLSEVTGQNFAPGTGASFTYSAQALDLPEQYRIKCMTELGQNLMLGTIISDDNDLANGVTTRSATIFSWNRTSSSFDIPIELNDFGVHQILNINNLLFITAGNYGHIYLSNGSSTKLLRKIPKEINNLVGSQYMSFYPGAVMSRDGKYYFGNSRGSGNNCPVGMWSVDINGRLVFEQQLSSGTVTSSNALFIGAMTPIGEDSFWMSYRDNTNYRIDSTTSTGYPNYVAYVISQFYKVGTKFNKSSFTGLEFDLDKPLTSNQGLKIYYRTASNGNWTQVGGTLDYATIGGVQSYCLEYSLVDLENIQIKVEMTEAGSTGFGLREIRLFRK